jgi:hypothetical protein
MRRIVVAAALAFAITPLLVAQETKKVPKDSMRVSIPGCVKGQMFTAARRTQDEPGNADVPEGTHIRMNGPKKMMAEIKAQEGSLIQITGLMKKGQYGPGVRLGGGITVSAGPPTGGSGIPSPGGGQLMIDIEGWRPANGSCPSR